jgi:hypothetical protein
METDCTARLRFDLTFFAPSRYYHNPLRMLPCEVIFGCSAKPTQWTSSDPPSLGGFAEQLKEKCSMKGREAKLKGKIRVCH